MAVDPINQTDAGKHRRAMIAAIAYAAAGIALAVLFKALGVDLGVTFAILMLSPVLLYLIASGSISEFSGPGGFGAKFRDIAAAPVKTAATIESLEFVSKENQQALITRRAG